MADFIFIIREGTLIVLYTPQAEHALPGVPLGFVVGGYNVGQARNNQDLLYIIMN